MAKYRIAIKLSAIKELESIDRKKDRQWVVARISSLASNPGPSGGRKLALHQRYRLRISNFRIIYQIHDEENLIDIVKIGHRRDVYR